MDPLNPPSVIEALRKNTDLLIGTQRATIARSIVAMDVTIKPGVAGRIQLMILEVKVKRWWSKDNCEHCK